MMSVQRGSRVRISGDAADLWIVGYNARVDTFATVEEMPTRYARKLLITLDGIDGNQKALALVRRSRVIPAEEG